MQYPVTPWNTPTHIHWHACRLTHRAVLTDWSASVAALVWLHLLNATSVYFSVHCLLSFFLISICSEWQNWLLKGLFTQNENSVISYSLSCHFKFVWLSLFCGAPRVQYWILYRPLPCNYSELKIQKAPLNVVHTTSALYSKSYEPMQKIY